MKHCEIGSETLLTLPDSFLKRGRALPVVELPAILITDPSLRDNIGSNMFLTEVGMMELASLAKGLEVLGLPGAKRAVLGA